MNRMYLIVLMVLLVVFAGITLSIHQAKSPLILRIVSQQSEIIDLLSDFFLDTRVPLG